MEELEEAVVGENWKEKDEKIEDMDIGPPTEVHLHSALYSEEHRTLPFPGVSANWYERQNELAVKNIARERHQQDSIVHLDEDTTFYVLTRVLLLEHYKAMLKP